MPCQNKDCPCHVKINHKDTMKFRNRIVNMPTQEWVKWHRKLIVCKGSLRFSRAVSFAFIVRGLKKGLSV